MKSGRTLWEELQARHHRGVAAVKKMQATREGLKNRIDSERFTAVNQFLETQHRDAVWFRDAEFAYFTTFARWPFSGGCRPKYNLDYYKSLPPNAAPPE